jgi:hypothetical protein
LIPKADKRSVKELIEELLKTKTYLLPTFQRDYVWDEEDVKDFIDSMIKGYPVGSVILWKPSRKVYEDDPFSKPIVGKKDFSRDVYYVIDGQQRLTTLLLMFNNWKISREDEKIEIMPISIKLEGDGGYKLYKSKRYVNIYDLLKSIAGSPIYDSRTFRELSERLDGAVFDKLCEIVNRILAYEIPLYILGTYDEDEKTYSDMAEAFVRVNKSGVEIGNVEMILSFLAGTIRGSFKNDIVSIYKDLEHFRVDLQPVIRAILSEFDIKQSDIKAERFRKIIDKVQRTDENLRRKKVSKIGDALKLTAKFLEDNLGIKDTRILPSQIPLITIAKYFSSNGITDISQINSDIAKLIESWFVLVSFIGYYSSQTDTKLEEDLKIVREHRDFPFNELLNNIEKRRFPTKIRKEDLEAGLKMNVLRGRQGRSYLFLLYVLLIKNDATDWTGEKLKVRPFDGLDRHHIFPRDFLRENLEVEGDKDVYINNIGNITFVKKEVNSEIGNRPPHEYLPDYRAYIEKHFIPMEENLWRIETYETFLKARIDIVHLKAREFYPEIFV